MNQRDGTFIDEASSWGITAPTNGRGVVCADIDRDGDIDIEAMAFIAAAGRSDLISHAWLNAFMEAQRQDGGFAFAQEDEHSNAHATGLALWLALQLTHQNRIYHGLIAQPW